MCKHSPSSKTYAFLLAALCLSLCSSLSACGSLGALTPTPTLPPTAIPPMASFTPLTPTNTPTDLVTPTATITLPPVELLLTPTTTDIEVKYAVFKTRDDIQLVGKLFSEGETTDDSLAVILAHQGTPGANHKNWQPFAELIAGRGFPALAFDFRDYGGSQTGGGAITTSILDVQAAIDYLQTQGYNRIACIGASMGGTACLKAATQNDLAGIGVISSQMSLGPPTVVTPEEIAALTIPKLFLFAENDPSKSIPESMNRMYDLSPEPKRLRSFPGSAHGTEMFAQPYCNEFSGELLLFLEALR